MAKLYLQTAPLCETSSVTYIKKIVKVPESQKNSCIRHFFMVLYSSRKKTRTCLPVKVPKLLNYSG